MKDKSCCFLGHRVLPQINQSEIKNCLIAEIEAMIRIGVSRFLCTGKVGFDALAAHSVLEMKTQHPHIQLVLVLPSRDSDWPRWELGTVSNPFLTSADETEYVTDSFKGASIITRGLYLASHSSYCIAYQRKNVGATAKALRAANRRNVEIVNIAGLV